MLDVALDFLVKQLNAYFASRTSTADARVDLGKIVDDTGKWAVKASSLGVALINVDEERILKAQLPDTAWVGGRNVALSPSLKLNLHVLVAANFQVYAEALKQLSHVLTFFQAHPVFTAETHPALDPRIDRLAVELESLGYEQLNQVWAFVGGKQLPSVVYRVRMIALQDPAPESIAVPITTITSSVHGR